MNEMCRISCIATVFLATVLLLFSVSKTLLATEFEHECDALAANPDDPLRIGSGIKWDDLDSGAAIEACNTAVKVFPLELRFKYQLGRAFAKGEDYTNSLPRFREAAQAGYSIAQASLGTMYDYGEGVAEDDVEAVKWYRNARPPSRVMKFRPA